MNLVRRPFDEYIVPYKLRNQWIESRQNEMMPLMNQSELQIHMLPARTALINHESKK